LQKRRRKERKGSVALACPTIPEKDAKYSLLASRLLRPRKRNAAFFPGGKGEGKTCRYFFSRAARNETAAQDIAVRLREKATAPLFLKERKGRKKRGKRQTSFFATKQRKIRMIRDSPPERKKNTHRSERKEEREVAEATPSKEKKTPNATSYCRLAKRKANVFNCEVGGGDGG